MVKPGSRHEFATGVEHDTGKTVSNFRGTVARKGADGRLMVNAGTASKPKWVVTRAEHIKAPEKKAPATRGDNRRTYADRLTEDEKKAVLNYQSEGYKTINGALRTGRKPSAITAKRIAALDSAVAKGRLEKDATLYRGFAHPDPASLVGREFVDHGFVSTSEGSELPLKMAASRRDGVYTRIKASAGANVGYLQKVGNRQATSKYGGIDEREALLPRGARFKVTSARQDKDGMWIMDMELLTA